MQDVPCNSFSIKLFEKPVALQSFLQAMGKDKAFQILGMNRRNSRPEIREAYLTLIRQFHPDVSMDEDAHERSVELNQAYQTLLQVFGSLDRIKHFEWQCPYFARK